MNTRQIRSAAPNTVLHDDKVRGLQLRSFPTKKVFYCFFRVKGSNIQRRPKIGVWPAIELGAAREIASAWLEKAAQGIDPVREIEQQAAAPTVAELCARYMERHGSQKKSKKEDQRLIDKFIAPKLGSLKVADVRFSDIDDLHRDLSHIKVQANRVVALLSTMFSLAEKWEMRPRHTNPCHDVARYKERKRKRYIRPDEAAALFTALGKYRDQYPEQCLFIWLLVLTGARPVEIATMKRSQRVGTTKIEMHEHKTDDVLDTRVIHLPPQAADLIDAVPAPADGTMTGIKSPRYLWEKIIAETKIEDLHLYDLRHSFASAGLAAGISLAQIGELLGHKSEQTTKRYAHLIDEIGAAAATKAADVIEGMMRQQQKKEMV
jgi:integrase